MTDVQSDLTRSLRSYSHTTGASSFVGVEVTYKRDDNDDLVFFFEPLLTSKRVVVLHITLEQARAMTAMLEDRPEPGAYFWEAMGAA